MVVFPSFLFPFTNNKIANRWINDTDNWIFDEEDTDKPVLCGNLTGARHCPTGILPIHEYTLYTY